MDQIKEELDENLSSANSCFLCLEAIPLNIDNSEKLINSTNSFFKYLKIRDEIQAFVCANCGDNLTKFVKLCSTLEKVRVEMDYLLDSIKAAILNSNFKPIYSGLDCARQLILTKGVEDVMMANPKPEITLEERMDTSGIKKEGSPTPASDCSNDYILPNCEIDAESNGSANDSDEDLYNSPLSTPNVANAKPDIQERIDISKKQQSQSPASDSSTRDGDDDLTPATRDIAEEPRTIILVDLRSSVKSSNGMERNIIGVSPEALKCSKCSKTFCTKRSLKNHTDNFHLGLRPFKCPKCTKMFVTSSQLKRHMEITHLNFKPHKCDMCDMAFRDECYLRRHKNFTHLGLRPFQCQSCPKSYTNKTQLERHINGFHLGIKPYMCDLCGESLATAHGLKLHKATPHEPKQIQKPLPLSFSCKTCGKMFRNRRRLYNHEYDFHSENRFKCDICSKAYRKKIDLKKHISWVHEKKRHSCQAPGCNKSFARKSTLGEHYKLKHPDSPFAPKPSRSKIVNYLEKVENGEYVVECKLCTNKFSSIETAKYHIKSLHESKTFLCAECGFSAPYEGRLKRHVEEKHNKGVKGQVKSSARIANRRKKKC